jgi:hypothetical protein
MNVPDLDEFVRYVVDKVNPARREAGLIELREKECEECFRILYEFWKNWER